MKWLFERLITLGLYLRYPNVSGQYRWFMRFGVKSRFVQWRYFLKDYLNRTPYRELEYHGEFAPEMKFVLPYAYWHFKNGTLKSTESVRDTACFYFFSPNHIEKDKARVWSNYNYDLTIPNSEDHSLHYNYRKWLRVPLKAHYENEKITFDKPTLVISNKYNSEWGDSPVNFLSLDTLDKLFLLLKNSYQIVYNRPSAKNIVTDNSEIKDLNDLSILKKHQEVWEMNQLFQNSDETSFNRFQLRLYAGCQAFISVQGGNSILSSYFGGTNIVYAVRGMELGTNQFETIYPKLSGAKIHHCNSYEQLLEVVRSNYLTL